MTNDQPTETVGYRVNALQKFLSDSTDHSYDHLTALAASVCSVPVGVMSLKTTETQQFKSVSGVDRAEPPADTEFCKATFQSARTLVVEDALTDNRFRDHSFVIGEPGVRFYAGVPLKTDSGEGLGTLCVIDTQPGAISDNQRNSLSLIGETISTLLEMEQRMKTLSAEGELIKVCAWCHSVEQNGGWMPIERYLTEHPMVSHSICRRCSSLGFPQG